MSTFRAEQVSLLMDGELDEAHIEATCATLHEDEALSTWACYHVIGDALRGMTAASISSSGLTSHSAPHLPAHLPDIAAGFSGRFASRLAAEPTILAPKRRDVRPFAFAWAAAATLAAVGVVGWVALQTFAFQLPPAALATAQEANALRAARLAPPAMDSEYFLAHQEFSPAMAPGMRPYVRAVAVPQDATQ